MNQEVYIKLFQNDNIEFIFKQHKLIVIREYKWFNSLIYSFMLNKINILEVLSTDYLFYKSKKIKFQNTDRNIQILNNFLKIGDNLIYVKFSNNFFSSIIAQIFINEVKIGVIVSNDINFIKNDYIGYKLSFINYNNQIDNLLLYLILCIGLNFPTNISN